MTGRTDRHRGSLERARLPKSAHGALAFWTVLLAAMIVPAGAAAAKARAAVLLGDTSVERLVGKDAAGQAEAFPFVARASGTAASASLYVDSINRATTATVALYSSAHGHPRRLLSTGSIRKPRLGAWNVIRITSTPISRGRRYWLAVLGKDGSIHYRIRKSGQCSSRGSAQRRLKSFPVVWRTGTHGPTCPISAYVTSGSRRPVNRRHQPKPPTPPTSPPMTNCVIRPSTCGYPDATNSGVPQGTPLTPESGDITAGAAGETISNINLTGGTITVTANNVTIKDSEITTGDGQLNGQSAIDIKGGVTGTQVEYVTMQGGNCQSGSLFAGVMNESGDQLLMDHDYGNCVDDILHGSGTIQNSYSIDNANIPNDHYEPVADDGGNGSLTVDHDTFLNPHGQVAAVFTQCTFGDVTALTIENSLLAGGDYAIYGPLSDSCGNGGGTESVTGNRFSQIYYPDSGQYGVAIYFPSDTTWSNNYWDATLQQIPDPF